MIYQPVLQWGPSAAGGGNFWTVASWVADGSGRPAFHSPLRRVNAGSVLVGEITLTGQTATRFNYRCRFQGIPFTTLPIQNVNELRWCIETLEAYNLVLCSNYPATPSTSFR
jgi:hypothetical protein